ncbi:hypothetical protein [Streptomyces sp. NBC_00878]|nr:hypothetical protein [Streptomyces sp. NBC_00878]MCX4911776.1 hypothetical protein [Streptomyces sp. NBC_00878]
MRRAYQCLENRDLATAQELLTENVIANVPVVAEPLHGREVWRKGS